MFTQAITPTLLALWQSHSKHFLTTYTGKTAPRYSTMYCIVIVSIWAIQELLSFLKSSIVSPHSAETVTPPYNSS